MGQISYGTITITDTNDIESIVVEYAQNQSSTTAPTSGWSTTRPTWQQDYYIWQRTRTHKTGTATTADIIGTAVCITGSTGSSGTAGRGLTGTTTTYCNYGSGTPADDYASWSTTIPAYDSTKPNYWVKVVNTYSSAPTTETIKYKDQGITDAMTTAAEANEIAASAEEKAAQAESVATNVVEDAHGALSIARATEQHFWFNPITSGTLEAGAYITDTAIDTFKSGKAGGYLLARSDGLILGKASNRYMELTGSELKFYKSGTTDSTAANASNIAAKLSTNGLDIVKGSIKLGEYNSTTSFYPFQVDSDGQFFSGSMASDNQAYIRVYKDTNDNDKWKTSIQANEIYLTASAGAEVGELISSNAAQIALKIDRENLASEINAVADQITLSANRIVFQNNTVENQLASQQTGLTNLQNAVQVDPTNSSIILGDESSFHIKIIGNDSDEDYGLGFYYGTTKVSYMSDQRLNIPYSVVLKEMQLSDKWSWTQKESGNMTLVWIGETTS